MQAILGVELGLDLGQCEDTINWGLSVSVNAATTLKLQISLRLQSILE